MAVEGTLEEAKTSSRVPPWLQVLCILPRVSYRFSLPTSMRGLMSLATPWQRARLLSRPIIPEQKRRTEIRGTSYCCRQRAELNGILPNLVAFPGRNRNNPLDEIRSEPGGPKARFNSAVKSSGGHTPETSVPHTGSPSQCPARHYSHEIGYQGPIREKRIICNSKDQRALGERVTATLLTGETFRRSSLGSRWTMSFGSGWRNIRRRRFISRPE
ncbi:hypothetical protein DPEC_G00167250 [Dallia pectoralis]|uniref:Uncharacterized protein n=1 Tax=Dallia pectoralis TaxID=75939 RepID=A0ACC2GI65_DALPE|nr:hypothetical protein DPEC_G00167250 [Dallia pectoralis]